MRPKIMIDNRPEMNKSWNVVFGDTTNVKKSDKKEIRGIIPYEWVISLIQHLCDTCLAETHTLAKFHTNIELIDYQLYEARNNPVEKPAPKPIIKKKIEKVIPVKVKPEKIVPIKKSELKVIPVKSEPKIVPVKKPEPKIVPVKSNKPFLKVSDKIDEYEIWDDYDLEENHEEY